MKLSNITLLSVGTIMVLSGCQERGKVIPPSKTTHLKKEKKKKETWYDFPVLKLSANPSPKEDNSSIPTKLDANTTSKTTSSTLRFPKKKIDAKTSPKDAVKSKEQHTEKIVPKVSSVKKKDPEKVKKTVKKQEEKTTKKITHTRRRTKKSTSSQIPILSSLIKPDLSLHDIPILNSILPKPSEASKGRIRKPHPRASTRMQKNTLVSSPHASNVVPKNAPIGFSGGTSTSGLDMAKIRIETDNYQTNVIFDSYKWVGYNAIPNEASDVSGTYFFKYEPARNRIVADIKGYNTFSALLTKQDELLKNNPMVKSIYIDRYIGDDSIKFIIELKQAVKVNVIDVEDPASIIVELYPLSKK